MTNEKSDKPIPSEDPPSEDVVLRRMLNTAPTPHETKRPAVEKPNVEPKKPKGKGKINPPERKRNIRLNFDMGVPADIVEARLSADGRVTLVDKDGNDRGGISQVLEIFRERENPTKGPKPLSRIPLDPANGGHLDPDAALMEFERVFVFDTNTVEINGEKVSVAAIIDCEINKRESKVRTLRSFIEFANPDCPPDSFTLYFLLSQVARWPVHPKLAFVTDWDVGSHAAIQARQKPVIDNLYLPKWATLLFATSDATDHFINQQLREADRKATSILDALKRGDDLGSKRTDVKHVSHLRFLDANGSSV